MSRTVKAPEVRRNEILDKAQELFYAKGYEQTSIRDIIDGVGIAKGTFYHYFSSKIELLDELVERMIVHIVQLVEPIVEDADLNALEKFHLYFSTIGSWKIENKDFLIDLMQVFYNDDNVLFRHKLKAAALSITTPSLSKIIRQGVKEGCFQTRYPDEVSSVLFEVGQSLGDSLASMLLENNTDEKAWSDVHRKIQVTHYSIERLLGAPEGSINIYEFDILKQWFESSVHKQKAANQVPAMVYASH